MVFRPEAGYADKLREVLTLPDADFNHGKNQNGDTLADHMMVCIESCLAVVPSAAALALSVPN